MEGLGVACEWSIFGLCWNNRRCPSNERSECPWCSYVGMSVLRSISISHVIRTTREALNSPGICPSAGMAIERIAVGAKKLQILGTVIAVVSRLVVKNQRQGEPIPLQWLAVKLTLFVVALLWQSALLPPLHIVTSDSALREGGFVNSENGGLFVAHVLEFLVTPNV